IKVDVRVIAATSRDLKRLVDEGRFREDLYHRLSVFRLELPPLRARPEDLEDLLPPIIAEFNAKAGKQVRIIPPAVWEALRRHPWPGNVRELRNVVERCVLFADSAVFPGEWLQLGPPAPAARTPEVTLDGIFLPLDGSMALEDMDRHIIRTALERHGYNVLATARALGTTRETLRYRMQKYRLRPPQN
ncbi:MAG TPA: helix-turn-helix domain-containing protein, partial [Candidatus Competibacteraceae bacterium]|nr:helix-turn-helix domain-containing protein [Candidatus Competibacteraceae bacterium]